MSYKSNNDGANNTSEAASEVRAPLVFYCKKCKTIVGDSYAFVSSDRELSMITLSAASNIVRLPGAHTSKKGLDVGSTFYEFSCSTCKTMIGRFYITTSGQMDSFRESFSFLVNEISSYELGKAERGKLPEIDASIGPDDSALSEEGKSVDCCKGCKDLVNDLGKVQQVLISLCERMDEIEDAIVSKRVRIN